MNHLDRIFKKNQATNVWKKCISGIFYMLKNINCLRACKLTKIISEFREYCESFSPGMETKNRIPQVFPIHMCINLRGYN